MRVLILLLSLLFAGQAAAQSEACSTAFQVAKYWVDNCISDVGSACQSQAHIDEMWARAQEDLRVIDLGGCSSGNLLYGIYPGVGASAPSLNNPAATPSAAPQVAPPSQAEQELQNANAIGQATQSTLAGQLTSEGQQLSQGATNQASGNTALNPFGPTKGTPTSSTPAGQAVRKDGNYCAELVDSKSEPRQAGKVEFTSYALVVRNTCATKIKISAVETGGLKQSGGVRPGESIKFSCTSNPSQKNPCSGFVDFYGERF